MKSDRPVIGITADIDDSTNLCSVNREYGESVWQAGGLPLIIEPVSTSSAYISTVLSRIDGVILSGGGDIDPAVYGQTRRARLSEAHPRRDAFEKELVARMHAADIPVLGICRGMQMMNVALGGTLAQDISLLCPRTSTSCSENTMPDNDAAAHQQGKPYETPFHRVEIAENTLLWKLQRSQRISCDNRRTLNRAQKPSCQASRQDNASAKSRDCENGRCLFVNSMHHQAIERIARELTASALCGSIVEAVEDPRKAFFLGVQWHPEYLDTGSALFEALCQAARKHHRKDLP